MQTLDTKPWYKQFWPWFIIALPATAVIASLSTVWVAVRGADSMVVDNYYKEGLAINQQMDSDNRAKELGLNANVTIDTLTGELLVELIGKLTPPPTTLTLALRHPADAKQDTTRILKLAPSGKYVGELENGLSNRWYVQIDDPQATPAWRLRGEIDLRKSNTVSIHTTQQ